MPDLGLNSEFMLYADDTVLTIPKHSIGELYGNRHQKSKKGVM